MDWTAFVQILILIAWTAIWVRFMIQIEKKDTK